jgi:hypothetical protein
MARYYELLLNGQVFSKAISTDLRRFFSHYPKPFGTICAQRYAMAGKGGSVVWTRPPKHYAMMGWSLGPVTGKLITELISGQPTSLALDALSPERRFT